MARIADVMRLDFIEVAPEDTLGEVAERMTAKNVGAVVVKDFGNLIGILTERDLLKAMAARVHSSEARVRQWMTVDPVTAAADTDVEQAARVVLEHDPRRLSDIGVCRSGDRVDRHPLTHPRLARVNPGGHRLQQVALGEDPDQVSKVLHHHCADVLRRHSLRDLA